MSNKETSDEITISRALMRDVLRVSYLDGWKAHKSECSKLSAIPSTINYVDAQIKVITDISERREDER